MTKSAEPAALVLAAATGFDFDRGVALARWGAGTVIEHVVATAREAGLAKVVVVLGAAAEDVVASTDLGDAVIVIDPEWEEGAAAPLRAGLDFLMGDDQVDVAILLPVEQPGVASEVIATVVDALAGSVSMVVSPKYRYAIGSPFAVRRDFWPRLMGLEGDARADTLFRAHPGWVESVWVDRLAPSTVMSTSDLEMIAPRA